MDSGIVAIAIGIMAATAAQEIFGSEKAGTARMSFGDFHGDSASTASDIERKRFMSRLIRKRISAAAHPARAPNSSGSCPRKPLRYLENKTVARSVMREMTQTQFDADAGVFRSVCSSHSMRSLASVSSAGILSAVFSKRTIALQSVLPR